MSYIKLDRKMLEWEWRDYPEMVALWVYILLKANYKANKWHGEEFPEGTFPTSLDRLSADTGLSVRTVRTCLERLNESGEISIESTKKGTKIKVTKWADFQGSTDDYDMATDTQTDKQVANNRQTTDKQPTTLKEYKNIRNVNYKEKENIKEKEIDCSPEFAEALKDFEDMRKKNRKPLTEKAKQMLLKKLESMASDEETQIAILNQSTMNSWQGIFPLDTRNSVRKEKTGLGALMETTYD